MVLENGERKGKMIREGKNKNECARKRKNLKGGGEGKEEEEEDRRGMTGNEK